MDLSTHSSMYVAPLQISKDMSRTTSSMSDRPQTASSTANSAWGIQQPGQMTPPLTPHDSEASFEKHPDFQTYLRAFYPYHPTCDDNTSTVTLPLNSGDIILVHSVHTNGWADGTLLTSGDRGWLPTNYCEGYDNDPIRPLMKALTVFWDLVRGSNIEGLAVFRNSDYVRGLVAGVRCLLVRDVSFTTARGAWTNPICANKPLRKIRSASIENQALSNPTVRYARIVKRSYQIFRPSSKLPKASKAYWTMLLGALMLN